MRKNSYSNRVDNKQKKYLIISNTIIILGISKILLLMGTYYCCMGICIIYIYIYIYTHTYIHCYFLNVEMNILIDKVITHVYLL